jgi:DNA-directed RNA polymerase subunit M/transcription elongation factor TFIIS
MENENSFFEFLNDIFSFFNRKVIKKFSVVQMALISADEAVVKERAKVIADAHYKREDDWEKSCNNTCPNCGAKRGDIVNKIREVHGSGSGNVSGNLFGVYGSSSMSIGTDGVNHCNKCGNEWKKYKRDFKSSSQPPRDGVKYVARIIRDPEEYKWAIDYTEIFNGCYVETILKFAEDCTYDLMDDDKEVLCFSELNKYYKSVWDDPNVPKKLLKLL